MTQSRLGTRDSGLVTRYSGSGTRGPKFVITLLVASWAFNVACSSNMTSTMSEPFPSSGEVAGWVKSGETRTFPAANLWEYIDGDADRYIQAGIEQTLTADYKFQSQADAVADVHIFKGPEGPTKLLAAESSADSRSAGVGDESRLFASSLIFRKGRYLVRATAYEETPETAKALLALGQAIEKKLEAR